MNKTILQQHYPGFWEELNKKDDGDLTPEDIKIETAPTGDPALCIKGMFIHSPRDPKREAQRYAERIIESVNCENCPIVILGFGLGYAAQAAAASGSQIIIVEKYKSLILKALELRDFCDFLSNNRIIFVVGPSGEGIIDALAIASAKYGDERLVPSVIRNKALAALDEQWYRDAEDRIRTWSMKDKVNTATHKRFGKRWVRNLLRNKSAIRDYPGISHLADLAAGELEKEKPRSTRSTTEEERGVALPVFLAAAGPSLDKIKPMLRDIHDRCIVVAVDTSLRFFVKNGIQPDFVLVVDPQFWNSRHLDRCVCLPDHCSGEAGLGVVRQAALIAESAVYPPVLNLPFKNIFLCGSLFPLGTFIEKQVDPKGKLGAGGSVATTAWDFARFLGTNEIWIAGLDLAFPDLKTHFRGARFEENFNSQSYRFNPIEKWIIRALRDGNPFKARSANGGQVLTDQRLSLYAAWFQNQFQQNTQIQNFSLFQDGLAIAGLQAADMEKFLTLPQRRSEIDRRIQTAFLQIEKEFNDPQEKCERTARYENAVSVLERGLISIKIAAKEGEEITQRVLKYLKNETIMAPYQQNKVVKDLDEVMRRITESEVKEIAGFLLPPMEEDTEEKDPFCAYIKSSLGFFSGIIDAVEINLI